MADEIVSVFADKVVTTTKRVRVAEIRCSSPHNAAPGVTFVPEEVAESSDGTVTYAGIPAIGIAFDPARIIYLRDPETDKFTGDTTTWGAVFVALKSAALDEVDRAAGADVMKDRPAVLVADPAP